MRRFRFDGSTAVLTGAAGGIGAGVAEGLAARGCHLILVDRDTTDLAEMTSKIRAAHPAVQTTAITTDLSDPTAVADLTAALSEHREINLLVNNAGVALVETFDCVTMEEFDHVGRAAARASALLLRLLSRGATLRDQSSSDRHRQRHRPLAHPSSPLSVETREDHALATPLRPENNAL